MSPTNVMAWVWGAWFLSWLAASSWANRTETKASLAQEAPYRIVTGAGVVLLFMPRLRGPVLWATPLPAQWLLVVLAGAGFAFCWWARLHIGRLWSATVTRKTDHHIVDTGPYALVRHPIYTGLILAAAAAALLRGALGPLAGFTLIALGCWMKARLEERFLAAELGRELYEAYRRRVGMLTPRLRARCDQAESPDR
jgi:protein-S-isoprenylcysteine O-methyltransferase Ste14